MKQKKDNSWLRPRGYVHFTKKFDRYNKEDSKFLYGYVSTPETISKHSFFPLIHRPIIARRYKKIEKSVDKKVIRSHFQINSRGEKKSTAKTRHIYYSTHIDAYIYSYYCKEILEPLYESKVKKIAGLSDCISAYRKIPIYTGALRNKNNIHFADDVFKFIKNFDPCVALTFDVSSFFDSLNQKYLKQQWTSLLKEKTLPDDHHSVFKSLTRITFVEYSKILKEFGIENQNKLNGKKFISFCKDVGEFKKRIKEKNLIREHPYFTKNGLDKKKMLLYHGIPQGTPISAFLSNLYLFEFDKIMLEEIVNKRGGLYKRYSDDIVVVCKEVDRNILEELVLSTIKNKFFLTINREKVDTSNFFTEGKTLSCDKPLRYLGFEFDGTRALIKAASISKYYRQMKRAVKAQASRARHNIRMRGREVSTAKIYKHDLFKGYSHLASKGKDRNFYIYAKEAAKIMGEKGIMGQLSQAWPNLQKEIEKYDKKYALKMPKSP